MKSQWTLECHISSHSPGLPWRRSLGLWIFVLVGRWGTTTVYLCHLTVPFLALVVFSGCLYRILLDRRDEYKVNVYILVITSANGVYDFSISLFVFLPIGLKKNEQNLSIFFIKGTERYQQQVFKLIACAESPSEPNLKNGRLRWRDLLC